MSYLANSDIEKRLGAAAYVQLTDDEGTGSANQDRVDEARLGAEGEANSYLARRYAVPVDLSAGGGARELRVGFGRVQTSRTATAGSGGRVEASSGGGAVAVAGD